MVGADGMKEVKRLAIEHILIAHEHRKKCGEVQREEEGWVEMSKGRMKMGETCNNVTIKIKCKRYIDK